jgi:hypothetical protein
MKKLIDLNVRQKYLKRQFAYQARKWTISALYHLVRRIEDALRYEEVAMSAFIDFEGSFDQTPALTQ